MRRDATRRLIVNALREDIGPADITTELTVPEDATCSAQLIAKQAGVLSGIEVFRAVFDELRVDLSDWNGLADGSVFERGQTIASFAGPTRGILTCERTALNFLQRLSGVATLTRAYVDAIEGSQARIIDTRKTTPGFRALQKAAVRHGGGANHRNALYDGVLIKDNHIAAAGGVAKAIQKAKTGVHHLMKIEIEVACLDQLDEALAAKADVILLDNMDTDTMRTAVQRGNGVLFEASGNVSLETVRAIAETGVNLISIGALTHSAPAADLSLNITL